MTNQNLTNEPVIPHGENLPTVTLSMLYDFLADMGEDCFQHKPGNTNRKFRWFSAISKQSSLPVASADDARLLFVCSLGKAESLLEKHPHAFLLALSSQAETPAWVRRYSDRIVIIQQQTRFSYFIFLIQAYFMQQFMWESELDRVVLRNGTLDELLDASNPLLKNFMFVTDNNFNVISRTKNIEPPDDLHSRIIAAGCLSPQMIEEKRLRLPEKTFYIKQPSDITPFSRLSHPIYINHIYFGSLSMSCNGRPLTEGLKDVFSILLKQVAPLCDRIWRTHVNLNIPHYFFFTKLLEHEPVSKEYLRMQFEVIQLNESMQFKLLVLEIDESIEPEKAAFAVRAANRINQGSVFCFAYQGNILVLSYTPPSDSRLSHRRTISDLDNRICTPLKIDCGVSEIFEDITNLDLAYRQAKIALGLKDTIESEQFATNQSIQKCIYLFSDAFLYCLVDPQLRDERFIRFCFSHSVLQKIHDEDSQNGTNHLALFWFFLHEERNATAVAQRLHMHRNTVLYHIDKIQKRFDFDLSQQSARERMLLDFKMFFLTTNHASIEQLFSTKPESSPPSTY